MQQQRNSVRHKSLLRAIVYFDENPFAAECVVRNLSESGARLAFRTPPLAATDRFDLQIARKGERHRCQIVWRSDVEFGVTFLDVPTAHELESVTVRVKRLEAEVAALNKIVRTLQRTDRALSAV